MVIIITGASHTGKTRLAQMMLNKYKFPYLSIDHLKMGLIRSGNTNLTPMSDDNELTSYLWPIVSEMIKTAIENEQNLIVEGCYVPSDYKKYFDDEYLKNIKYVCLIMSENYIKEKYDDIMNYANAIEKRLYDDCPIDMLIEDNKKFLNDCIENNLDYFLIESDYNLDNLI